MGRVILDSSVLIAFYDEVDAHHLAVHRQFEASLDQYEISALTITEVLTAPLARTSSNREKLLHAVKAAIQKVHPVTEEIAVHAGEVRVKSGLKTPDAIISSTATLAGAILWTLDQKLAKAHKGSVLIT
jgi:predicted nucleic acid-binding protein